MSDISRQSMKMKLLVFILCLLVFSISFHYIYNKNKRLLTDTAYFGGDVWEYQSLAVNMIRGHGYQTGGIEEFSVYRFDEDRNRNPYDSMYYPPDGSTPGTFYQNFLTVKRYLFYRTPGYPLFLAAVYSVFGIHPAAAYITQMVLLSLSAVLLILISTYYWGKLGLLSGVLASFGFVKYFLPSPLELMTECVILFSLGVWVLFLIFWESKPNAFRIFVLGIATAGLLLLKGSNILIPVFFLAFLILRFKKVNRPATLAFFYCLGCLLALLPWSIFASVKNGSFVLLSTQTTLFLDTNNEDSLKDGKWHPTWRKQKRGDPSYLYNRENEKEQSYVVLAYRFLNRNADKIPRMLVLKFKRGFPSRWRVILTLGGMTCYYLFVIFWKKMRERVPQFPLIYFFNILMITLIFYGSTRITLPFMPFLLVPATYITVYCGYKILQLFPIPGRSRSTGAISSRPPGLLEDER